MGVPFGYLIAETLEGRPQFRKEIRPLARKYRQDLQFAIVDPIDLEEIVNSLHLNVTHFPAFAIREPITNLRYPMDQVSEPAFVEAIENFVQDFLNGDLQPTVKSEPLPPEHSEETLVKIVGLNYQDIVMDGSRDVLVVFCISPCGPCEAFQPTLEALANLYALSPELKHQVTIGKVMCDANDTPERGIRSFPTIKLNPAASKRSPETFLGPRTLDQLAKFIRDKGTFRTKLRSLEEQTTGIQELLPLQKTFGNEHADCAVRPDQLSGKTQAPDHSEL